MDLEALRHHGIRVRVFGILGSALLFLSGCGANITPLDCKPGAQPRSTEIIFPEFKDGRMVTLDLVDVEREGLSLSVVSPGAARKVTATADGSLVFETGKSVYTTTLITSLTGADTTDLKVEVACK